MEFVKAIPQVTLGLKPGRGTASTTGDNSPQQTRNPCGRKNRFTTEVHQNLASNSTSKYFCIMNIGRGKVTGVSVAHFLLGIIMAICGGLQIKLQLKYLWLDSLHAVIWVGIWMMLTAVMGIIASFTRTPVQPNTTRVNANTGFIIVSTISTTLGLEIAVYYIYTFTTSWDVYQSSSSYKIIAFVTFFLAIVEVIIGLVAATFGYLFSFHEGTEPGLPQNRVAPTNVGGGGNDGIAVGQRNQQPMNQNRARVFLGASTSNGEGVENGGTQARNDQQPMTQLNSPRQHVAGTKTVYKHISDGREWGVERNNTDGKIYYYQIERGEHRTVLPTIPPLPIAPEGYQIENREVHRDEYHDEEWLSLNGNGERGGYCHVTKGENRVNVLP